MMFKFINEFLIECVYCSSSLFFTLVLCSGTNLQIACSMSDSELDIYQELFAKIQENRKEIGTNSLDSFEVLFNDGDTVLETWVSFYYFKNILECGLHM